MKVLKQGAEAVIYSDVVDGEKVLVKERTKKSYRLEQIDSKLRLSRTRQELKLMREARGHGVPTPRTISSDERSCKILMEHLDGETARDFLDRSRSPEKTCTDIGKAVGKLHSAGMVHGDLTTSNIIVAGGKVHLIDFGLGQFTRRVEDMAVDLSVFLESLRATHSRVHERCWKAFLRGYKKANPSSAAVLEREEEIESRGRYKRRERPWK